MRYLRQLNQYRDRVFNVYWTFFLVIFFGLATLIAGDIVRNTGFPWLFNLVTRVIPAIVVACILDPLLFIALIIGGLFIWSCPWGRLLGNGGQYYQPDNVIRGRRITGPQSADYRAYQQLLRHRNQRRRHRRIQ